MYVVFKNLYCSGCIYTYIITVVTAQEGPGIVITRPGQGVELLCNVTSGIALWSVNGGQPYTPNDLFMGLLAVHNISLTGRNIHNSTLWWYSISHASS